MLVARQTEVARANPTHDVGLRFGLVRGCSRSDGLERCL